MSAKTIFNKENRFQKGHILACRKEIPFEYSKCTFSDSKNASTVSIKCLKKTHNKKDIELELSL